MATALRYVLVKCPRCRTPKILDRRHQTGRCYKCKKVLKWRELPSFGEWNTVKEAHLGIKRYKGLHVYEYASNLFKQKNQQTKPKN